MNNLERLQLLEKTLRDTNLHTIENVGVLANDVESLCAMLDDVSEEFSTSFSTLWGALEVVATGHQERGTEITKQELADLEEMKKNLLKQTVLEILDRTGE